MTKAKSTRSGGTTIKAGKVDVGDDVVGRDKNVTTVYNYTAATNGPASHVDLPHQPYFYDRDHELARISKALEPRADGWGIVIEGPGGFGKTALAIRAAQQASLKKYPTKLLLSAKARELTPQGDEPIIDFAVTDFQSLMTELARGLGEQGIERVDPQDRPKEVLQALKTTLIIIDNLETFQDQDRLRLLQFCRRLPESCKAIVTSRRPLNTQVESIRLKQLPPEAVSDLVGKLAERNKLLSDASEADRQQLIDIAKGNPLLIEWVVGQLGRADSKCRSVADACRYLEETAAGNDPLEFIFGDLLDILDDQEQAVLAALAQFKQPASLEWVANVAEIPQLDAKGLLDNLTDWALVVADESAANFYLPPLTNQFLRRTRSVLIARTGERLTRLVRSVVLANGYKTYANFKVLNAAWPAIAAALPMFVQSPNDTLQQVCEALDLYLEFSGQWDTWLTLCAQAEKCAAGANDFINAGWRAYYAGYIHSLRGSTQDVMESAKRTEVYWANASDKEKSYTFELVALANYPEQKDGQSIPRAAYQKSIEAYEQALDYRRRFAAESDDVVMAFNDLAEVEREIGDDTSAEAHYLEGLRLAEKLNYLEGQAYIVGNLADLAIYRKNWPEAESRAHDALKILEHVPRLELIAYYSAILAEALAHQERFDEGRPFAQQAVDLFQRLKHPALKRAEKALRDCDKPKSKSRKQKGK